MYYIRNTIIKVNTTFRLILFHSQTDTIQIRSIISTSIYYVDRAYKQNYIFLKLHLSSSEQYLKYPTCQ